MILVGYRHRKESLLALILEASRDGASKHQILKKARHWPENQIDEFISHSVATELLQRYSESGGEKYRTTKRGLLSKVVGRK
jgi:hypothetical protein